MAQMPGDSEKKRRFSVLQAVQKEERPDEPLLRMVFSDDQTTDLVRKISQVSSGAQENILADIKTEPEMTRHHRRRPSLLQALKDSKLNLSLQNKDASVKLLSEEGMRKIPEVAEETDGVRQNSPAENTTLYTKRLVEKNGSSNVLPRSSKRHRFINDFYTTLSDLKWKHCLLMFIAAYISTWTLFAMIYYVIITIHRDTVHYEDPDWDHCIVNVYNFVTSFLFSIETQHTIGYGSRAMKQTCPTAVIVYMIQSCASVLINSLFCGLIFAKLMSPRYRSRLIRFSRQAVISFNKGVPSFIFRVIDFQESNLVNCKVKAVLIRDRTTKEGEFIPFSNRSLSLHIEETVSNNLFIVWPVNVIHAIDSQSPLFGLTPRELQEEYLEIIVILEGVVENSGKLMQVRTSYTSREILWGGSFSPMLTFNQETNRYEMDYAKFDEIQITLPLPYASLSTRYLSKDNRSQLSSTDSNGDDDVVTPSQSVTSTPDRKYFRHYNQNSKSKKSYGGAKSKKKVYEKVESDS